MKAPATALPWHLGLKQAEQIVYDSKGWAVANATVYHGKADLAETKANAAYISHAANAYPQLVAALRECLTDANAVGMRDAGPKARKRMDYISAQVSALLASLGEQP